MQKPVAVVARGLIRTRDRVWWNSSKTSEVETWMRIGVSQLDPVGVTVKVLKRVQSSAGEVASNLHSVPFDGGYSLTAEVCYATAGCDELLGVKVCLGIRALRG